MILNLIISMGEAPFWNNKLLPVTPLMPDIKVAVRRIYTEKNTIVEGSQTTRLNRHAMVRMPSAPSTTVLSPGG
jgi:hypothetical protein